MKNRIGQGIDVHQLIEGTSLTIGGVSVPFHKGSKGHSDGDPLYHAIVDAILGSLALGDIGQHFPSNDYNFKDTPSNVFLKHANALVQKNNCAIINIDATIILQEPQLNLYFLDMKKNISNTLSISLDQVSIKATTTDHLGFIGTGNGIAALAVVLLLENNDGN